MNVYPPVRCAIAWLLATGAATLSAGTAAQGQTYPAKPIRIVVPFASGVSEVAARLVAQRLTERWSASVVVDPRPGANGIIAAEIVARAPADGYTLLAGVDGIHTINPHIYRKLPYRTEEFVPITQIVISPLILIAHPSLPVRSVSELVALGRARPGKLDYSSPGLGNTGHLAGEMFSQMAGVSLVHVPYKGGAQGLTALLAGEVTLMFSNIGNSLPYVQQGRVKALATTAAKRIRALPQLATMAELGYADYEAVTWTGLAAPGGTSRDVAARIAQEVADMLRDPKILELVHRQGMEPGGMPPEAFAAALKAESARYAALVKRIGFAID